MERSDEDKEEITDEISSLPRNETRRQRRQLRFAPEEDEKEPKISSSFKPPGRASRFLSIAEPSIQLPGLSLLRLQQLHNQALNDNQPLDFEDISDELLAKIPFQIEIIPDRRDDFDMDESLLTKKHKQNKEHIDIPKVLPSGLSDQRRLQIIEEILKDLSHKNILDEVRRSNAIPFQLPKNNQLQKNVAQRIEDLTGNDTVMLNDHMYMKNLCQRLDEKYKEELNKHFERLESNEKRRRLLELTDII